MRRRIAPSKILNTNYGEDILNHETKLLELLNIQDSIHAEGEELIKVINLLHDLNYTFQSNTPRKIMRKLEKYLESNGNNDEPISDDFKCFIKIFVTNKQFCFKHYKYIFFRFNNNKNPVVQTLLEILFDMNFKFDLDFIKRINKNAIIYHNEKLNQQIILDHNLIVYFILSMCYPTKINQMLFDNVMSLINTTEISLNYVLLFMQTLIYHQDVNDNETTLFMTSLVNNILVYNFNNINVICDYVIKNCYSWNEWVFTLFLKHEKLNDIFVKKLCGAKQLHNNFIFLLYAMQNNYVITIDIINNLLSLSETCEFGEKEFDENCANYIQNNFKETEKFKLIDYCELFNCKPNDETFKIALNKGYNYTLNKIIKGNNIIPDINTLNECIKSRDIKLINDILCYKIEPTELTLENLVLSKNPGPINNRNNRNGRMRRASYRRSGKSKKSIKIIDEDVNSKIISIVLLLIKNGLKINLNCVSLLLSIREDLVNLENYDIEYDEKLYFECYINNYFPDEYKEKFTIDKNIINMRTNRKIHNYKQFKELMQTINVDFDYYMLENSYKIIKDKHNFTPSMLTMYKLTNTACRPKAFKNFIKTNNITKEMMTETLKINF